MALRRLRLECGWTVYCRGHKSGSPHSIRVMTCRLSRILDESSIDTTLDWSTEGIKIAYDGEYRNGIVVWDLESDQRVTLDAPGMDGITSIEWAPGVCVHSRRTFALARDLHLARRIASANRDHSIVTVCASRRATLSGVLMHGISRPVQFRGALLSLIRH